MANCDPNVCILSEFWGSAEKKLTRTASCTKSADLQSPIVDVIPKADQFAVSTPLGGGRAEQARGGYVYMDEGGQRQEAAALAPACLLSVPHSRQTVESS